jgi:hypothetical protein
MAQIVGITRGTLIEFPESFLPWIRWAMNDYVSSDKESDEYIFDYKQLDNFIGEYKLLVSKDRSNSLVMTLVQIDSNVIFNLIMLG